MRVRSSDQSGARIGVLAVRPDGSVVIVVNPVPHDGGLIAPSRVGIQDATGQHLLPAQSGSVPRQAVYAVSTTWGIFWIETASTDLDVLDWQVFASSSAASVESRGSSRERFGPHPVPQPPGVTVLTAVGSKVWWTTASPSASGHPGDVQILVRDSAENSLTVAVVGAKLPSATRQGLYYVKSHDVDASVPAGKYEVRRNADPATVIAVGVLSGHETVSNMCAADSYVAWSIATNESAGTGTLHILDLGTRHSTTIALQDSASSLEIGCGDSVVAWGNGSGNGDSAQYVFDTGTRTVWKVGDSPGISVVHAAGDMVAWTLPPATPASAAETEVVRWGHTG